MNSGSELSSLKVPKFEQRQSLDEIDRESFAASLTRWDAEPERIVLSDTPVVHPDGLQVVSVAGEWQLAEGGRLDDRLGDAWSDAIPARVPGSVHGALVEAGRLADPAFGLNQIVAREESFKTWWMRRRFTRPESDGQAKLSFGGIANRCAVWLNGRMLDGHEGMFGGPDFDVGDLLETDNDLVVRLDPILYDAGTVSSPNPDNNNSWKQTVVFNNVYGWHYSNLPSLGIW